MIGKITKDENKLIEVEKMVNKKSVSEYASLLCLKCTLKFYNNRDKAERIALAKQYT